MDDHDHRPAQDPINAESALFLFKLAPVLAAPGGGVLRHTVFSVGCV
jgi:hypothetical protein